MKKLLAILALAATAANAQYVDRLGNYLTSPPSPYAAADGRLIFNPSWSHILADGGREATAQETADWQAAQAAAAQAAANAQAAAEAQAALPTVYTNGVEVPWVVFLDATNRAKGIAMELTTNNVPIYYEFHASPVDWKKVDANRKAALSAASLKEKDSADMIAYAKEKAAKDEIAKAEAVAATNGKEPTDKEKTALMWKHYLAVVGAEKK